MIMKIICANCGQYEIHAALMENGFKCIYCNSPIKLITESMIETLVSFLISSLILEKEMRKKINDNPNNS